VLTQRYEAEAMVVNEQQQWEDQQIRKSTARFGARDKVKKQVA
jgi:hypothetical protein